MPIEEIVEFDLGIEIRPIRGLRARFHIEGSLSTDLTTLVIDESLLVRQPNRYRFTLAHEVGHLILHAEQIQALARDSTEAWKVAVLAIPPRDYTRMEFQAYEFAGQVLVPRMPLLAAYQEAAERAEQHGIDLGELQGLSAERVAGWIARRFEISTEVVLKRLEREGLL